MKWIARKSTATTGTRNHKGFGIPRESREASGAALSRGQTELPGRSQPSADSHWTLWNTRSQRFSTVNQFTGLKNESMFPSIAQDQ